MNNEYKFMQDNKALELLPLPEGVKLISCKWVCKTKQDFKGNLERYEARLVAKGYTQNEMIDYKNTFSQVSSKDSFKAIMTLVAHHDLKFYQMDVKTTFLSGDIDKMLYIVQLQNFVLGDPKNMVCNLIKLFTS